MTQKKSAQFKVPNEVSRLSELDLFQRQKVVQLELQILLRSARTIAQLSSEELSKISGIPQKRIEAIESGTESPRLSEVYALSNYLGISPRQIVNIINKFGTA